MIWADETFQKERKHCCSPEQMLLAMIYAIYILFKLEMEVIGPLFCIYIITFVLTAHSDLLNGKKLTKHL